MKLRTATFLLLLILSATANAEDAPRAETPVQDRYVALYRQIFEQAQAAKTKPKAYDKLCLADVAVRLGARTGQAAYAEKASRLFDEALPEVAQAPADFHTLRMVALLVGPLARKGLLSEDDQTLLRKIAARTWKAFLANPEGSPEGDVDHNIRLAEALGCAALSNHFPEDRSAEGQAIRPRLERYWQKIKATGDLDEDASNYTALGIVHCIELSGALGHEADLRSAGFRRMFARQRDLISPTGILPEFGDGFFHLERDAFDFLFVCEYAAKTFEDPTFLTVARRLYDPASFAKAPTDEWCRGTALIDFPCADAPPRPLPEASVVSYRANRSSPRPVADKMILRTGTDAGSAMVMLDLYASGSHAHRAKGPSVAYYEADGVPLFHNLGRHRTRSAITGNSFWAIDGDRRFPGVWKPGEWFTMSIPAEMLNRLEDGTCHIGDRVSLRNFENRGTRLLWFDNLRLEGRQGTRLLDGFESPKGWHRSIASAPGMKIQTSPDHTQGQASQALNWGVLKAGAFARMLENDHGFSFKEDDLGTLKIDLKYEGIRPYLHLRDLCQQIDLGDHALAYSVGQARVEQRGRDAFGEIRFDRYVGHDAPLVRRIILTAEGYLIIHDLWSAGASLPEWKAGQLWQLYALKEQGKDWFCSEDDGAYQVPREGGDRHSVTRSMLVKFAMPAGTEVFAEQIDQHYLAPNPKNRPQEKFFTVGSVRPVKSGEKSSFMLVVVPQEPKQDPKAVAEGIAFTEKDGRGEVSIGKSLKAAIGADGTWQVVRTP